MFGDADKTEEPTSKRLSEARQQGNVAKSQDLTAGVVLTATLMLMGWLGPHAMATLTHTMRQMFGLLPELAKKPATVGTVLTLYARAVEACLSLVLPVMLVVCVTGVLIGLVQVRPLFTLKPLQPNLNKINPLNGIRKLFNVKAAVESVKSVIKLVIVTIPSWVILQREALSLLNLGTQDVRAAWGAVFSIIAEIVFWSVLLYLVIGTADYLFQRYEWKRGLRMTRQQVRDERKQEGGNSQVKGRIKKMGFELVRRQMMVKIQTADVLIMNPTHFAVALQYDPDVCPAPRVVAKGVDHLALKLKEVAKAHGVPVVENPPLARSLYATVELEHMIPPELFLAVAEVLAYVFKQQQGRRPRGPKR